MTKKDISYIINQLGEERENYYNAVSPPIIHTSNFCFNSVASMGESLSKEMDVPFYTRGHNPTVGMLRQKMAALEGAEDSLIFSSGVAAISAAIFSSVKAGDHIVCVAKPYSWTITILNLYLPRFGVTTTMIDGTDASNFEKAIQPNTKLFYLESPNTFTFELQDLEAVSKIAKKHGITTVIDNSYSSPLYQTPIEMGVDIVVHSATKYLGGHSDTVAGVLCSTKERVEKIFYSEFMMFGGIISPNSAWLLLRSLRTLPLRMERSSQTTLEVLNFLDNHPKVEKVIYPFHPSHPQYELAKKQMKKGGGLFSMQLKAKDFSQIEIFCDSLKRFLLACSWGGHESLVIPAHIIPPAKNSGSKEPQIPNPKSPISIPQSVNDLPFNLVRIYIGLEDADMLIEDLSQALEKVK